MKNMFKNFLLKIKYPSIWREYKERVIKKIPTTDYQMGPGYYLMLGLVFVNVYEENSCVEFSMKSGKTGLFKLIHYSHYSDPDDMVKSSEWQFLGYSGEKLIQDMSFEEFVNLTNSSEIQKGIR